MEPTLPSAELRAIDGGLDVVIEQLKSRRDGERATDAGRDLSLAITYLETAQDKIGRAAQSLKKQGR